MPLENVNSSGKSTGHVEPIKDQVVFTWKMSKFFTFSEVVNGYCYSPEFLFSNSIWYLVAILNFNDPLNAERCLALCLVRKKGLSETSVDLSFGVMNIQRDEIAKVRLVYYRGKTMVDELPGPPPYGGWLGLFNRPKLLEQESEDGSITFCVFMNKLEPWPASTSLMDRFECLSASFRKILSNGERSDVLLKVGERDFAAHKIILESRSSYFAAMFRHDYQENKTNIVHLEGIRPEVFDGLMTYLYCADVHWLSDDNACEVYQAADRFDVLELQLWSAGFLEKRMRETHSWEWSSVPLQLSCDTLELAIKYGDEKLEEVARDNITWRCHWSKDEMVGSDVWKKFEEKNQELAKELLLESASLSRILAEI